jgi:hypothetical protein
MASGSLTASIATVAGLLVERKVRRREIAFVRSAAAEQARALVVIDDHHVTVGGGLHAIAEYRSLSTWAGGGTGCFASHRQKP